VNERNESVVGERSDRKATLKIHPELGLASNGDRSVMNEGVMWMERRGMMRWGKEGRKKVVRNETTREIVDKGKRG